MKQITKCITKQKMIVLSLLLVQTVMLMKVAFANTLEIEAQPAASSMIQDNEAINSRIEILENKISILESRMENTENKYNHIRSGASMGAVSFLFGAFCALWAQNTRRNAFGWFIIGLLGTVFAVLAVLWYNHYDKTHPPTSFD